MTKRVLVVKTSSLGDLIHSFPALTDACQALGDVRFDWVAEQGFCQLPALHPAVERVIPVAIRRWRKSWWRSLPEIRAFKRDLQAQSYDAVIDAQGLIKSAWISRQALGPRHGLDKQSIKEPLASRAYQHRHAVAKGQHAVERTRQLFSQALGYTLPTEVGRYQLRFSEELAPEFARACAQVAFLHGTTWATKHYPETYWRALAEYFDQRGQTVCLPWGNDIELRRAERIAKGLNRVRVLPKMGLLSLAQVLSHCQLVIGVDSGLTHLAAALEKPVRVLFGPTNPQLTGAYGAQVANLASQKSCAPCMSKNCRLKAPTEHPEFPPCFADLSPEQLRNDHWLQFPGAAALERANV